MNVVTCLKTVSGKEEIAELSNLGQKAVNPDTSCVSAPPLGYPCYTAKIGSQNIFLELES